MGFLSPSYSYSIILFLSIFYSINAYTQKDSPVFQTMLEVREPAFAIKFMDAVQMNDQSVLITGRFDYGEHQQHKERYAYDRSKYPSYIQTSFFGHPVTILHKVDAKGKTLWTKLIPFGLQGTAIASDGFNSHVITGYTPTEREKKYKNDRTQAITVMKVDSIGEILWSKILPSDYNSTSNDIVMDKKGDLFILGDHQFASNSDWKLNPSAIRLIKLNSKGDILWERSYPYDSIPYGSYHPTQLCLRENGDLFILGTNSDIHGIHLLRLNSMGYPTRIKEYNWPSSEYSNEWNYGFSMVALDSGFVFSSSAYHGKKKGQHLVKIDDDFNIIWETVHICDPIEKSRLAVNHQQEIFFATNSDDNELVLAKYSKEGDLIMENTYPESKLFRIAEILCDQDGKPMIIGQKHTRGISDWISVFYKN